MQSFQDLDRRNRSLRTLSGVGVHSLIDRDKVNLRIRHFNGSDASAPYGRS